jgi:hypothetical protein
MERTFSITLIFFVLVWAFAALDGIGKRRGPQKSIVFGGAADPASLGIELVVDSQEVQFLAENPAIATQVQEIDRQILELQAMKRGFDARALRHEDYAQRLQFEDRAVLETRRHLELADENRAKAARVQQEIDRLQMERRKLMKSG